MYQTSLGMCHLEFVSSNGSSIKNWEWLPFEGGVPPPPHWGLNPGVLRKGLAKLPKLALRLWSSAFWVAGMRHQAQLNLSFLNKMTLTAASTLKFFERKQRIALQLMLGRLLHSYHVRASRNQSAFEDTEALKTNSLGWHFSYSEQFNCLEKLQK